MAQQILMLEGFGTSILVVLVILWLGTFLCGNKEVKEVRFKEKKNTSIWKKVICVCIVLALLIQGSKSQISEAASVSDTETTVTIKDFVGNWKSSAYAIGKDYVTMGFDMTIEEDGSLSMANSSSGNPAMIGKVIEVDDSTIKVVCDSVDFDPPWTDLQATDQLEYHFYNENMMRLTYKDISIVYTKNGNAFTFSKMFSDNWKKDKNKDWYTSDGTTGKVTYKLKTYVDTILLYKVEKGKETLLGSFSCLSYNSKTNVIKTITELSDASKLPKNWRMMKEGRHFQNFTFNYDSAKHALKVTFDQKTYTFYSNLTYGVNKQSDYSKIYNHAWICKVDGRELQFDTSINQGIQQIYITDLQSDEGFYGKAIVEFNESKKQISLKWLINECTTEFYKTYKSQKTIPYSLKSSTKLVLKLGGKNYTFTKVK